MFSDAAPTVKVYYFASVRTTIGCSHDTFTLPSAPLPLSSLIELISSKYPETNVKSVLEGCRWSVDNTLIEIDEIKDWELKGGEEVGAIPPVSGG